jgi:hypothetical protein
MYYKSLDHVLAALVHAKTNPKKALAHFKAASRCADLSKAVASLEKHQRSAFASLASVGSSKVEAAKKAKNAKKAKKKVKAQMGDFDALIDDLTKVEESDLGFDSGDDLTLDDISNDLTSIDDEDSLDADLGLDDLDLDDVEMDEGLSDGLDDLDLDGDLDGDDLDGEFASDDLEEDEEFDLEDEEDEEIEDEVVESSAKRGRGRVTAHASAVNRMARANSNLRALSRLSTTASAGKSAKKPASRRTPGV